MFLVAASDGGADSGGGISIFSLGKFVRAARVGVVERLSFDRTINSCESRGAVLWVPCLSIKE